MNDNQKQIEEIASYLDSCPYAISNATTEECKRTAKILIYEANCRIVDEGSVVLSKGAYESISNKAKANVVKAVEIRKQAVKEVLSELKKVWEMRAKEYSTLLGNKVQAVTLDLIIEDINETAKEFGVEYKE